jgi:hypothetical protein
MHHRCMRWLLYLLFVPTSSCAPVGCSHIIIIIINERGITKIAAALRHTSLWCHSDWREQNEMQSQRNSQTLALVYSFCVTHKRALQNVKWLWSCAPAVFVFFYQATKQLCCEHACFGVGFVSYWLKAHTHTLSSALCPESACAIFISLHILICYCHRLLIWK